MIGSVFIYLFNNSQPQHFEAFYLCILDFVIYTFRQVSQYSNILNCEVPEEAVMTLQLQPSLNKGPDEDD
jgi:hypothetical protein